MMVEVGVLRDVREGSYLSYLSKYRARSFCQYNPGILISEAMMAVVQIVCTSCV
jgi:hypothetical protein